MSDLFLDGCPAMRRNLVESNLYILFIRRVILGSIVLTVDSVLKITESQTGL